MSKKDAGAGAAAEKESLLLSMVPFAGLALLLVLALVWKYLPSSKPEVRAEDEPGAAAVERWERRPPEDVPLSPERDFARGPLDAPVTLVEFSDFECPYCRTAAIDVERLLDEFGDEVRLVFKNLPLDTACNEAMRQQLHPSACHAAVVARCAGQQDEALFWKTHDALYRASSLSGNTVVAAAREAGADVDALEACVEAGEVLEEVRADIAVAHELGVTGTPTFYLNGRKVADYRGGALERIVEHILGGTDKR